MIKYKLLCKECDLKFDSWFASSNEYERLKKKKLLNCHNCNSVKVEKSIMAPQLISQNFKNDQKINLEKYNKVKKTIKEDTPITYLNASCFSSKVDSDISPITTKENIKTPINPIDDATIPLPASKKLKVFPCFFSPPRIEVALIIGAQKRKTVVKPQ